MKKVLLITTALMLLGFGCSTKPPVKELTDSAPSSPAGVGTVKLFMIDMASEGTVRGSKVVGCGDSVVPVEVSIPTTTAPLSAAFKALLALQSEDYNQTGLYNPSYSDSYPKGSFQFEKAEIVNGVAKVYLKGQLSLPGECEDPRLLAQFEETAKQFPTVKAVEIYIDGQLFNGSLKQ